MKRLLCVAVLVAGVSSPAASDVYVVGTNKNGSALRELPETETKRSVPPTRRRSDDFPFGTSGPDVTDRWEGPNRFRFTALRMTPDDDAFAAFAPSEPPPSMSEETLKYLTTWGVVPNIRQELRAMKENAWLKPYEDEDRLPLGAKLTIVTKCEIARARYRMVELGREIPGSAETPDAQFSWYHIHYGEGEPEEHVVLPWWCDSKARFWFRGSDDDSCPIMFNKVRYEDILTYAEEWKREHPELAECAFYRELEPPEKPIKVSPWSFLNRDPKKPRRDGAKKRP